MKTTKKYYILKRNFNNLAKNYFAELSQETTNKIQKRLDFTKPILLIEKTINPGNTESYTNMWILDESGILVNEIVKDATLYDYTSVLGTLVQYKGVLYTWGAYSELNR